jgi:hypothetical protein
VPALELVVVRGGLLVEQLVLVVRAVVVAPAELIGRVLKLVVLTLAVLTLAVLKPMVLELKPMEM